MHRHLIVGLLASGLLASVGCYRPALEVSCNVACSAPDGACPSGLVCGSDGLCKSNGANNCTGATEDATDDSIVTDALRCFGVGLFRTCIPDGPLPMNINISTTRKIDTGITGNCSYVDRPGTEEVCVIYADQILLQSSGVVRVLGSRPLVVLGISSVRVDGILDAASHRGDGTAGAGASTGGACDTLGPGGNASIDGGGGGAGGSFVGSGGSGGTGGPGVNGIPAAGATPGNNMATPTAIRGGCGGSSGGGSSGLAGGLPGAGGGAVYLISGGEIAIKGTINASGAGGAASVARSGGGGGGSGGFIGLDAPTLSIGPSATIFAIGGAGASGGNDATAGVDGGEAMNAQPPQGTASNGTGGTGSAGAVGSAGGGSGGASSGGGGGGGGGGGYIGRTTTVAGGTFAPPPRLM